MEFKKSTKSKYRPFNMSDVEEIFLFAKVQGKYYAVVGDPGRTCTKQSREIALWLLLEDHLIDFENDVPDFIERLDKIIGEYKNTES